MEKQKIKKNKESPPKSKSGGLFEVYSPPPLFLEYCKPHGVCPFARKNFFCRISVLVSNKHVLRKREEP